MDASVLAVCFLAAQFSVYEISAAPNCDLRTIFRTPRDFDQLELIERSSFDQDKNQDIRLKDDTRPHANAQILLRIGCDNENIKKTQEPCVPLSQFAQYDVRQAAIPQYHPMYQQHSNPLHMPIPFLFPNCLYYDALGALCSHFLPVLREVLARRALTSTLQGTPSPDQPQHSHSKAVDETAQIVDDILDNAEDTDNEPGQMEKPEKIEVEIEAPGEKVATAATSANKPSKREHKKAREGQSKDKRERSDKKAAKRRTPKKSNIQKIPEDGKVHLRKLLEADTNEAVVPVSAVKLRESRMSVKKEDVEDPESAKPEDIENSNPEGTKHLPQNTIPHETEEDTIIEAKNVTSSPEELQIAVVPVDCQTCNKKVTNLVSYPVFEKKMDDDDIEIGHCGCRNASQGEFNATTTNHHPFTVDMDDLSIIHGNPVTPEFSVIQDMAPKFLRNIVAAKTLAHYLPVTQEEPEISYVSHPQIVNRDYPKISYVRELVPHASEGPYAGCTCEHCLRRINGGSCYETQPKFVVVEEPQEEEVVTIPSSFVHRPYANAPLPGYLSRQMSRPLAIYESRPAQPPQELLVPVEMVEAREVVGTRCGTCAPYEGELNQS